MDFTWPRSPSYLPTPPVDNQGCILTNMLLEEGHSLIWTKKLWDFFITMILISYIYRIFLHFTGLSPWGRKNISFSTWFVSLRMSFSLSSGLDYPSVCGIIALLGAVVLNWSPASVRLSPAHWNFEENWWLSLPFLSIHFNMIYASHKCWFFFIIHWA